ncbi:cytochrome c (plasmid) [Thioclava sp. 'Guangxiensis']|uniref:cytochrome c n=1 Tax=Thioclava sp. 'Guangxiensis' TaxID=3149044 RepID=UPI0032C3E87E
MKPVLIAALLAGTAAHAQDFNAVEKGRKLAITADCAACHTGDAGEFAGGVPLETPFGTLVGSNITPDQATGIGRWTKEEFRRAVKSGKAADGHLLYPAMPYTDYANMTDADVDAIYDYLQTVPAVHNEVEENQLPFPLNMRVALYGWNLVNQTDATYETNPDKSEEWNRGRYIVMGPGHCAACHSPRNLTGGEKTGDDFLTGATLENWHAPDITADPRLGVGGWSEDEIIAYLKTGHNAYDTASGPMAEEVALSSSKWSDSDLASVAAYLKEGEVDAPASAKAPDPLDAQSASMQAGAAIYGDRCSACHAADGEGVAGLYPKLSGAPLVMADDPTSLGRVVLAGSQAGATAAAPTGPVMPSFGATLDNAQVAAVLDYIRNSWGNAAPAVDTGDMASLRKDLQTQ